MNKNGFLLCDGKKTSKNFYKLQNFSNLFFPRSIRNINKENLAELYMVSFNTLKKEKGYRIKTNCLGKTSMENESFKSLKENSDFNSVSIKQQTTSKESIKENLNESTLKEAFNIFLPQVKNFINNDSSYMHVSTSNISKNDILTQQSNLHNKRFSIKKEYKLETFHRSNQDTCLTHKPAVFEGDWVQSGDFLTDCANSVGGELSLGQNIYIAYMPWEGYNFEDAILISERLVSDDLFTSVHIERYEIENIQKNGISQQERIANNEKNKENKSIKKSESAKTAQKNIKKSTSSQIRTTRYEEITRDIPDVTPEETCHLDSFGIVKIGSIVEEGDILVGKITPINKKEFTPYQKLLYTILDKPIRAYRDSSLRAPKGIKAKVIDIKIFVKPGSVVRRPFSYSSKFLNKRSSKIKKLKKHNTKNNLIIRSTTSLKRKRNTYLKLLKKTSSMYNLNKFVQKTFNKTNIMRNLLLKGMQSQTSFSSLNSFITPTRDKLEQKPSENIFYSDLSKLSKLSKLSINNSTKENTNLRNNPRVIRTLQKIINGKLINFKIMKKLKKSNNTEKFYSTKSIKDIETIHIYLAEKRKIQVGDKMSGRHGNKGIVSQILPMQDMPFLPDGTPIDMVLNPLGVPSRMNVGQIYECLLGLAGKFLGEHYKISSFDEIYGPEASRSFVFNKLYQARCKTGFKWLFNPQYPGKIRIYDGRTGDCYHQPVTVGISYMLRLVHMVDDKIHMRSTGPYSLVTQQPLRGRSKQGGQRLGEMEVWALEGYGAAFTLLEMLTVKSDDLTGRMTLWSNLILNKDLTIGTPEAFKVLICELQALCLDIGLYRYNTTDSQAFPLEHDSTNFSYKSPFNKGPKKSLTEMTSLMSFP